MMIMININNFIQEKLKIGKTSFMLEKLKINSQSQVNAKQSFTDEELMKDYNEVSGAYTKAEKQEFAIKYDIVTNKIREIQIVILNHLRDNRFKKKEYDKMDFTNFVRYDLPEKYDKFKEYLDKEPEEFLKFVLDTYNEQARKFKFVPRSIADKYTMKRKSQLEKYLGVF